MDNYPAVKILALAGSTRAASVNQGLARVARDHAPAGAVVQLHDLRDVPFYDGDLEAAGDPPAVQALKDAARQADALLLVTPEYNAGTSAVLKNALDWLSRLGEDAPLRGKLVALAGAGGMSGTASAQQQLRENLARAGARVLEDAVLVAGASERFDENGDPTDPQIQADITGLLEQIAHA